MSKQCCQILGWIWVSLLHVVTSDERRVQVLRTGMRELVDHPRRVHGCILARPRLVSWARARGNKSASVESIEPLREGGTAEDGARAGQQDV